MNTTLFSTKRAVLSLVIASALSPVASAESLHDAWSDSKASASFRLRYEGASQDNAAKDASALTLRTLLSYESGSYKGFSFKADLEDVTIVMGQGDYTVGPAGYNPGQYSVIADPETTELNQGYLQYKGDGVTVKAGRQIIALDGHRFVGHVGWRQDWQTYDAISVNYQASEKLNAFYAYLTKRNRIFGEAADIDSSDHLLNVSYKSDMGKLTAYAYLLEVDNDTDNSLDTYGVSYSGAYQADSMKWLYSAEFATQSSETAATDYSASYIMLEGGASFSGIPAKLGYEVLGSDDGMYGFATPLATLHKFNGWSDQWLGTPGQGLQDLYVSAATKFAGGNWLFVYHDFSADESTSTVDDLGSEINIQYTTKFADKYSFGAKYANYSQGDLASKVDTDKLWVWIGTKF